MGLDRRKVVAACVRSGIVVVVDHILNSFNSNLSGFKMLVHFELAFEYTIDSFGDSILQGISIFSHTDLNLVV